MSAQNQKPSKSEVEWAPEQPHDALPPLPPKHDLESRAVLRACIRAREALARLDQAAALIPNPAMLTNTLPILEAQASSEIAKISTTADRLFQESDSGTSADPATAEAQRYAQAMMDASLELRDRPLSIRSAERICTSLRGSRTGVRKGAGKPIVDGRTKKTIYTPPSAGARLKKLLRNWEQFLRGDDEMDPLVRLAVAHYQFEAIHPFEDGNGRTGRILNSLLLVESGLLQLPILFMSRHLAKNQAAYRKRLLGVTKNAEWEAWILFMLDDIESTAQWTRDKILAIDALMDITRDYLTEQLPKIYSEELMNVLFEQPYCRIAAVVEAGIVGRQAASRYLKGLAKAGILEEQRVGREALFAHKRLLRVLTADTNLFDGF